MKSRDSNPMCPVPLDDKAWIEDHFTWLTEEFGYDRLRYGTLVLPTTDFFAGSHSGTTEELADTMCRVAEYMDTDPTELRLRVARNGRLQNTPPDDRFDISVEDSILEDPLRVIAALSHEIGLYILLEEGQYLIEEGDQGFLADLLTVFSKLGIFTANAALQEEYWQAGLVSGWRMDRYGYLSMNMFGYAFSLFALARGEKAPEWSSYLRPDVRTACNEGISYITETGDCIFRFLSNGIWSDATDCLACGETISVDMCKCPNCGWTWKQA